MMLVVLVVHVVLVVLSVFMTVRMRCMIVKMRLVVTMDSFVLMPCHFNRMVVAFVHRVGRTSGGNFQQLHSLTAD